LSLTAVYLLGNHVRSGFLVFVAANLVWILLGVFWMNSMGIALGNSAFLVMNLRGYLRWTNPTPTLPIAATPSLHNAAATR